MQLRYEKDADVLYISLGKPAYTDYKEVGENLILRLDPETQEVVGFTVIDFIAQAKQQDLPLRLPLQGTFERTRRKSKTRVAAEKKTAYRVRRAQNGKKPRTTRIQ